MKGIDISHHNGEIDFNAVKNDGVEIVIIKSTEGKTYKDNMFNTYYNQAKEVGLKVGVYHFLRDNDTSDEINNLLESIEGKDFDCKIVIDMEADFGSVEQNSRKTRAFADELISKGFDICLYTGEYFYNYNLNNTVKDIPLWVAKYSSNTPKVSYIGWQFTETGRINGIDGDVDINDFTDEILILKTPIENILEGGINMSNEEVLAIQQLLNRWGIVGTNGQPLVEDGLQGNNTNHAIETAKSILQNILK